MIRSPFASRIWATVLVIGLGALAYKTQAAPPDDRVARSCLVFGNVLGEDVVRRLGSEARLPQAVEPCAP